MEKEIKEVLNKLHAIKNDDRFYFDTYGLDWIKELINKQLKLTSINNQSEMLFCGYCGIKLEHKVETDVNSEKVCKNVLCTK